MQPLGKRLLNNLNIGRKLTLCFGLLSALTLLVVVFNAVSNYRVTQEINRTGDVRVPAALASAQAQSSLQAMVADVHGYLALGSLSHIADYYAARRTFEANLAELERLAPASSNPEQTRRLKELRVTFTEWSALSEQMYALHNNPPAQPAGVVSLSHPGQTIESISPGKYRRHDSITRAARNLNRKQQAAG